MAIPLFLLVQVAVHDYHDIAHIDSFSARQCFENAHPEDVAAGGPDKWWAGELNCAESFILSTANPFSKFFLHSSNNLSPKLITTLRC